MTHLLEEESSLLVLSQGSLTTLVPLQFLRGHSIQQTPSHWNATGHTWFSWWKQWNLTAFFRMARPLAKMRAAIKLLYIVIPAWKTGQRCFITKLMVCGMQRKLKTKARFIQLPPHPTNRKFRKGSYILARMSPWGFQVTASLMTLESSQAKENQCWLGGCQGVIT